MYFYRFFPFLCKGLCILYHKDEIAATAVTLFFVDVLAFDDAAAQAARLHRDPHHLHREGYEISKIFNYISFLHTILFTTPFSSPVCSPNSLFRRELLYPLLFGAMADEDLAVLLGEDAVVDSLDDNPFAGFHMDNIV